MSEKNEWKSQLAEIKNKYNEFIKYIGASTDLVYNKSLQKYQ
jgi:hypothetical protein